MAYTRKFTPEQVREIRRLHRKEGKGRYVLAKQFNAWPNTIYAILKYKTYAEVR